MTFSSQQKAQCVVWLAKEGSPTSVQRKFRRVYGRNAELPNRKTIRELYDKFLHSGSVNRKERQNKR
jgi:hypothetical protein